MPVAIGGGRRDLQQWTNKRFNSFCSRWGTQATQSAADAAARAAAAVEAVQALQQQQQQAAAAATPMSPTHQGEGQGSPTPSSPTRQADWLEVMPRPRVFNHKSHEEELRHWRDWSWAFEHYPESLELIILLTQQITYFFGITNQKLRYFFGL